MYQGRIMSKGLDALKEIKSEPFSWEKLKDSLDIIEKELKECENYKVMYRLEHEKNQQLTQANLKMLKALEIIKNKSTSACNCIMILKCRTDNLSYEQYCGYFITDLTQEEYDLLKEVLL